MFPKKLFAAFNPILLTVDFTESCRTAELTWAETANTQREGNGQAKQEGICFRLTSNELLAAPFILLGRLCQSTFIFSTNVVLPVIFQTEGITPEPFSAAF